MKVILFGASGMVGQGVLRECLLDPEVTAVHSIVRSSTGQQHEKLREIVHKNFLDFSSIASELSGFDACFFCLGVSSAGMSEKNYRRVTYDIALAAAQTLVKLNSNMTLVFISGAGTDSSERGRVMWARVKGETENALLRLPFQAAYMFRPGVIVPLHGIKSRTMLYRIPYAVLGPILPASSRSTSPPPRNWGGRCSSPPSGAHPSPCSKALTSTNFEAGIGCPEAAVYDRRSALPRKLGQAPRAATSHVDLFNARK